MSSKEYSAFMIKIMSVKSIQKIQAIGEINDTTTK